MLPLDNEGGGTDPSITNKYSLGSSKPINKLNNLVWSRFVNILSDRGEKIADA